MSFSFDATAGTSQSTFRKQLEGNTIHTVKYEGTEITDIVGKKDPSQTYKVIKLKFGNEEGVYEHTVFEPKGDDFKRGETEFTNKNGVKEKIPQPSNVESMMLLFKHAIDAVNPTVAKMIDEKTKSISAPNWDTLRSQVAKILDAGKGTTTRIKLVKDKEGNGKFPGFFAGINREGATYIKNNFIGDKVAFNAYEADKINKEASANPSNTSKIEDSMLTEPNLPDTSLDLNFDVSGI